MPINISTESLGYWYLRLNGFLATPNFVVHPDIGNQQGTDVDVLGVRFPYRMENRTRPMQDESFFQSGEKALVVFTEIKLGPCRLNGPWTSPERENMEKLLSAVGVLPPNQINDAAQEIYQHGVFETPQYHISLLCIGSTVSENLYEQFPDVPQIEWPHVKNFVYRRFRQYRDEKAAHPQWDKDGKNLWECAMRARDSNEFSDMVNVVVI